MMQIIKTSAKRLVIFFFGIPAAILIRLLYPLIHIRLGILTSERIGHFAENSMHFFRAKNFYINKRTLDLFFLQGPPSNKFLLKLIRRELIIYRFVEFIYHANFYLPGSAIFYNVHETELMANWSKYTRDTQNLRRKTNKFFPFSATEDMHGNNFLKEVGCNNPQKFVCLNIRDSSYLQKTFPSPDFTYHDYRDSDCQTYAMAVNELIRRGYFIIRMGSVAKKKLLIESDQFFDYPFSDKASNFLDIWLMANCTFCISTSSGLDSVADIFNRPIAYVNALPLGDFNSSNPKTIWMPKIIAGKDNKTILLKEIIQKRIISFHDGQELERHGFHEINNTAEEILAVAIEIEEKITGAWDTSRDNANQRKQVENLLCNHWEEFTKYHNARAFEKESFGHFSETFLNKVI